MPRRSPTIDAIKGGLVILMVAYHACYIAVMFGLARIDLYSGFWWIFPRAIAAGFITVSGWNLAGKRERGGTFPGFAKRAGRLALVAALISAVTWPVFGQSFVFFGIIHLLAVSTILAYPLPGRPALAGIAGVACAAIGLALGGQRFDAPWLAWLGFRPAKLYPVDYLPLLPWFAFIAFGSMAFDVTAGRRVAKASGKQDTTGQASPAGPDSDVPTALPARLIRVLAGIGKRSLAVYLAHLPLLYALAWLLAKALPAN